MTTRSPRLQTVLEAPLLEIVRRLANQDGQSLSKKAAELIREAVEFRENRGLDLLAQARRRTFDPKKAFTLGQLRKRLANRALSDRTH